jgi:hypothetical protein
MDHLGGSAPLRKNSSICAISKGGCAELARIPHGHPTMSEAIVEAARAANGWLVHG